MNLESCTLERVAKEFSTSEQTQVIEVLSGYSGPEVARVVWDILQLSKGNLENVKHYLQAARQIIEMFSTGLSTMTLIP